MLIREQLKATPEQSDRQIAQALGVSNPTVSTQRKQMEESGELLKINSCIGADGKERPRQVVRKPVSVFTPTKREERGMFKGAENFWIVCVICGSKREISRVEEFRIIYF